MNKRVSASHGGAGFDRDAVRRAEVQVQSVLVAAGALFGALAGIAAAAYMGIESELFLVLGLLAASVGAAMGVAATPRVASAFRR
jgi:hypothetical protein